MDAHTCHALSVWNAPPYARRMDVDQLRALVTLSRERRFTTAARALGVSQPSLSRRVQQLEREVRARLFVRTARGVVPTAAGARFLAHAEHALAAVDAGVRDLQESLGAPHGVVALGTMPTVGAYALPDAIARFHEEHPAVLLRLHEALPDALEAGVADGSLDLAILNLPVRRQDLSAKKLWQEDYLLALPASHRLASRKGPLPLRDVAGEPLIVIPAVPATAALFAACEERGVRPRVVVEVESLEASRRLVERGMGLTLLPRLMARDVSKRVALLEISEGGLRRQVALVHRGAAYLSGAAKAVQKALVDALRRP
jgi:DNA-binding transcriptional LysR family regulator